MNKTYFLIATAAIALAGCSSNSRFAPMAGVNKSPAETTTPAANSGATTEAANNTTTTPTDSNTSTGTMGTTTTTPPANDASSPNTTNPSPAPFIPDNPYINNYALYETVSEAAGGLKLTGTPKIGTISAPASKNSLGRLITVDGDSKKVILDPSYGANDNTYIRKGLYYLHGVQSEEEKLEENSKQPPKIYAVSYVHGIPTPLNSMPTIGTASYTGLAIYDQLVDGSYPMTATADFSAKTFTGHIGQLPIDNQFSATISGYHIQPNESSKVRLSGSFVGENADGATGRFYDNYNNQGTFGVDKVQSTNP